MGIARIGLGLHIGEGVEDQQGLLEALSGDGTHGGVVQQVDEGLHVEPAKHGAQQLRGLFAGDQGDLFGPLGHAGQEGGLNAGCIIDAGGHPVDQEFHERLLFTRGGMGQQGGQFRGLSLGERQGGDAQGCSFSDMLAIGLQHGHPS